MRTLLRTIGVLLGLAVLLVAPLAHAQADVNLRIDRVDDSAFPTIHLFATVTDAQGRAVPGLGPDSFVLREGGKSVTPTSAAAVPPNEIALRVVLAIDISKSIEPNLGQIQSAATGFVQSLDVGDQVALVVFGNTARVVQPFTADHGAVINSILGLGRTQLEDYTALYNGVFEGVRLAADGATSGRRAVVVLTDGDNTTAAGSDSLALTDVQRGASERRVPVHVIAVGPKLSDQELRIIATDGRFLRVEQPGQLAAAYNDIAEQLRQQYLISYDSQLSADGGTYPLELSVNVPDVGAAQATANLRSALSPTTVPTMSAAPIKVAPAPTPEASSGIPIWVWAVIAAVVILVVIVGLVFLMRRQGQPVPTDVISPDPSPLIPLSSPPTPAIARGGTSVRAFAGGPVGPTQLARTTMTDPTRASLVVQQGDAKPRKLGMRAGKDVLIGRQPDAELVVNDTLASAQHARIRFLEGGFVITDINSTNGLWVNGRRVERVRLQDDDRITIGEVEVVFKQVQGKA
ncbi:MAG: FHA domain-containing protein [Chloroflexales bacterium]